MRIRPRSSHEPGSGPVDVDPETLRGGVLLAARETLPFSIGPYEGFIAREFHHPIVGEQLARLSGLLASDGAERLSRGPDYVVKVPLEVPGGRIVVAAKVFKRSTRIKDWYDRRITSKAVRSFRAAVHLLENDISTPLPVAALDRWDGGRLLESYYLCLFEPAVSFRAALAHIYHDVRDHEPLMELLRVVAFSIRAKHDAGFMHRDLNNQNILLPKNADGSWGKPSFIDLNRGRISERPLTHRERARDISRLVLPGHYLRIFKSLYHNHEKIPSEFEMHDAIYREYIEWHRKTSRYRHPIRYRATRNLKPAHPPYPPPEDLWLWDEKSAQPIAALASIEKSKQRNLTSLLLPAARGIGTLPRVYREYRRLLRRSFVEPRSMDQSIGVALHPNRGYIEPELALLAQLGNPPVLLRFCHHETPADWQAGLDLANRLHEQRIPFMAALLNDRRAMLDPESWRSFLETVIGALAGKATHFEITHAFNRVKWGIWTHDELTSLLQPAFEVRERYPGVKLIGPASIDFEYHSVILALNDIPRETPLDALSHLLYVDRRGAPENAQGGFSTLEKCALLKALARTHPSCADEVIVTEVNWPLKEGGEWSPVSGGYLTPKWRRSPRGVNEDDYANYMIRYLAIALCSGHVDQVYWWRLSAHGYGLVDDLDDFRVRPAFTALATFLRLVGKARYSSRLATRSDVHALEFIDGERRIVMAWTNDRVMPNPLEIRYEQALDRDGRPLTEIRLSGSPVYFVSAVC